MKKLSIISVLFLSVILFSCGNTENKTDNIEQETSKIEFTEDETTEGEEVVKEAIEVKMDISKEEIIAIMGNDFTETTGENEMTYEKYTDLKYGEDATITIMNKKVSAIYLSSNKYSFNGVKIGDNAKTSLKTFSNSYENYQDRFSDAPEFNLFIKDNTKIELQFDIGYISEQELTDDAKISKILVIDITTL